MRKKIVTVIPLKDDISFEGFDSGNPFVNKFTREVYYEEIMKLSSTKLIKCNSEVIGYYTINVYTILSEQEQNTYSAIRLRFIGLNKKCQNKGIGTHVLGKIIIKAKEFSDFAGCRYLILDAVKEKAEWYEKRGFFYLDESQLQDDNATITMYMDFQDSQLVDDYFLKV